MVPMLAMHMAVRNFFFTGFSHLGYGQTEAQGFAGQGVVAVQHDGVTFDLGHGEGMCLSIIAASL